MVRPAPVRRSIARAIIADTVCARHYFLHHGNVHPNLGDGSLMSRLLPQSPGIEPFADDPDFLRSLVIAAESLLLHIES
jgi:hypothetical protein